MAVAGRKITDGLVTLVSGVCYSEMTKRSMALFSVDWWKAFDRVSIDWVVQVMRRMGFGEKVLAWIRMFHSGAKARFILGSLTDPMGISFSVRQGDPLALILFVISLEPLLVRLVQELGGISLGMGQLGAEAFVDDVSGFVDSLEQLDLLEVLLAKFESVSGALVNRDKCKLLGLGGWAGVGEFGSCTYFQGVGQLKVLGVIFHSSYKRMLALNWEEVMGNLRKVVLSWRTRVLPTVAQRAQVFVTHALSLVWYRAQVLPLPETVAESVEASLGSFMWRGRFERVAIDVVKNVPEKGGLNLVDVRAKARCLLVKSALRLLTSPVTSDHYKVGVYWMGLPLVRWVPAFRAGAHPEMLPRMFGTIRDLLLDFMGEVVGVEEMQDITVKMMYRRLETVFPPPTVEAKILGHVLDWGRVWRRWSLLRTDMMVKEVVWMLLHNVIPTRERMFRCGQVEDEFCPKEAVVRAVRLGPVKAGKPALPPLAVDGTVQGVVHVFCDCAKVANVWPWVRWVVLQLLAVSGHLVTDTEILHLDFLDVGKEVEATVCWLVAHYIYFIEKEVRRRSGCVELRKLVFYLSSSYLDRMRSVGELGVIPQLFSGGEDPAGWKVVGGVDVAAGQGQEEEEEDDQGEMEEGDFEDELEAALTAELVWSDDDPDE